MLLEIKKEFCVYPHYTFNLYLSEHSKANNFVLERVLFTTDDIMLCGHILGDNFNTTISAKIFKERYYLVDGIDKKLLNDIESEYKDYINKH